MLLVDDYQAQIGELDALGQQCMGADHQLQKTCGQHRQDRLAIERLSQLLRKLPDLGKLACAQLRQRRFAGSLRRRRGQQRNPSSRRHSPRRQRPLVLLGQDLCRSHQRRLMPCGHRQLTRRVSDQRLTAADIAVKQALHRMRLRQILLDLGDRPLLRARRSKRQHRAQTRQHLRPAHTRGCGIHARGLPTLTQTQLQEKELFKDQATLRRR